LDSLHAFVSFLGYRAGRTHFYNLVVFPDSLDHLVLQKVRQFASAVLLVLFPHSIISQRLIAINKAACAVFTRLLELSLVNASHVAKLPKTIKFALFKIPNVLKAFARQLSESIRFTVPHLTLEITTICKLIAALACAFPIPPLASVNVTTAKHFFTLTVLPSLTEMTCVDITTTESKLPKAVLHVLMPLTLIAVSVLE